MSLLRCNLSPSAIILFNTLYEIKQGTKKYDNYSVKDVRDMVNNSSLVKNS